MSMPSPEQQQRARIFGVLFALTFVTSIAGLLLYDPVLNDADYILGDGADTRIQAGALCEVFLAITNIGTAVVLWPIVKRQSETLALSYVASRVVESVIIVVDLFSRERGLRERGPGSAAIASKGSGVASDDLRARRSTARRLMLRPAAILPLVARRRRSLHGDRVGADRLCPRLSCRGRLPGAAARPYVATTWRPETHHLAATGRQRL